MVKQKRCTIPRIFNTDGRGKMEGLFTTLKNKFKPQYNETLKSLLSCKLDRQTNQYAEE